MFTLPRILTIAPNPVDATSFYRSWGIIPNLKAFEFREETNYNWKTLQQNDVVYLQRPFAEPHLEVVKMARASRRKIWVDYDDDLFTVPIGNPAHKIYGEDATKERIRQLVAHADLVTCSTEKIRGTLYQFNPNVHVVPNAYNDMLLGSRPEPMKDRRKLVVWRGSSTHDADLAYYMTEILALAERFSEWTFCFIGEPFWQLRRVMPSPRTLFVKSVDPMEYWEMMGQIQPAIVMVPLEPNAFNEAKSNIAYLEGAYAGAVTVAPMWNEWKHPGVLGYRDKKEFVFHMSQAMQGKVDLYGENQLGWDYIKKNLCLSQTNQTRTLLLQELLNGPNTDSALIQERLKASNSLFRGYRQAKTTPTDKTAAVNT